MRGYEGVESLVYQALAKVSYGFNYSKISQVQHFQVMEQVEGGDLVVNKGDESRPKDAPKGQLQRDLGVVEGFEAAFKLAKVSIRPLITLLSIHIWHHIRPISTK